MGSTRAGDDNEAVPLRVGLRQWVLGLTKAELIIIDNWIKTQLLRPNRPLFLVPDEDLALPTNESFLQLAARIRLYINELPVTRLIVLEKYLSGVLREHGED